MPGNKLPPVIRQMAVVFVTIACLLTVISLSRYQGSKTVIPQPNAELSTTRDTTDDNIVMNGDNSDNDDDNADDVDDDDDDVDDDDDDEIQGWDKPIRTLDKTQNTVLDKEQLTELDQRFTERRNLLERACTAHEATIHSPADCDNRTVTDNFKYVQNIHVTYCQIQKTGCTLWKRILHVMGGWGNASNPLDIRSDLAGKEGGFQALRQMNRSDLEDIFQKSTNIMFVRDPYTRIFSAWLDKFYTPNIVYWNRTGHDIVSKFRRTSVNQQLCATDVTFEEFVKFVSQKVTSEECLDSHFTPSYQHCWQCEKLFNYQYVGKFETMKEDIFYLLNKLNMTHRVKFSDFHEDYTYDTIYDLINWLYTQKEKIQKCGVTLRCTLFTTWKRLQSRGLIGKESDFPYKTDVEVNSLKVEDVVREICEANSKGNKTEMRLNRVKALVKAFHSLSEETLNQFKKAFQLDFEMFGYEKEPEYLNTLETDIDTFEYFEMCDDTVN